MTDTNRIICELPCSLCDQPVKARLTKKNLLYYVCERAHGGCGNQLFCRDPEAEKHLARRATKWVKREDRLAYLGAEALPAKSRPAPEPEPENELEPEPEAIEPEPEPDTGSEPEPIEPPPPRRPAPRPMSARRPVPPQLQKKKAGGLGFFGEEE